MDYQDYKGIRLMSYLVLVCIIALSNTTHAQKYDYQWAFGYGTGEIEGFGLTLFDWNNNILSISDGGGLFLHQSADHRYLVGTAGACIADRDGKLALMTNNCHIIGSDTDSIPGGSHISPSGDWLDWCLSGGFQGMAHNTAFLPNRVNDSITYLIHRMREHYWLPSGMNIEITADTLYRSTIMQQTDGSYSVLKKNEKLLELSSVNGRVIGIPTEDELGWWVFTQEHETNAFYFQQINADGSFSDPIISETGPVNRWDINGDNALNISNDGRTIALSSEEFGTLLYRFDRTTGELVYEANLPPTDDSGNSWSDGFCWSPSNRFLYVAEGRTIVQYDLDSSSTMPDSIHIINVNGMIDSSTWPVSLGSGYLGPDCRIYFSSGTTSQAFHVIHYPDRKGTACTVQANIPLPNNMAWNFPMITKFRMGSSEEEVCDSSIEWFGAIPSSVEEAIEVSQSLQAFPNPSSGDLMLGLNGNSQFDQIRIFDAVGHLVYSLDDWYGQGYLDLSSLRSGIYVVKAQRDGHWHETKVVLQCP